MPAYLPGMPLARLLQHRLLLMIIAELVVVVALVAAAWHVWQSRQVPLPPAAASPPGQSSRDRAPLRQPRASAAAPRPSATASPGTRTSPGFRTDADFLARQMGDVNHDQSALERVEWRIVRAAIDGMRSYLEHIVLPAVERAERGGG